MFRIILISSLLLASPCLLAQEYKPDPAEDSLYYMFSLFPYSFSVEDMQELNSNIKDYMLEILAEPESFTYRFDSLRTRAGILESGDGLFRIFTWNLPLNAWEHEYHGILQVLDQHSNTTRVYLLENKLNEIPELMHTSCRPDTWPGFLYYDLKRQKKGREVHYVLMGFNFHDRWSDKKIIDVLWFDENMEPVFGKPVLSAPTTVQHRIIFEYSGEVAMNLRYNPDLDMIVYDHLAPIEPELENFPRFYAPDFTYDGYIFRRGMWEHRSEVDVRNR